MWPILRVYNVEETRQREFRQLLVSAIAWLRQLPDLVDARAFKCQPNLKAALKADIEPEELKLQLVSQPFLVRGYKRIAVKVVDVYGNESTMVKDMVL